MSGILGTLAAAFAPGSLQAQTPASLEGTVSLGYMPAGLALDPVTDMIYVGAGYGSAFWVVNGASPNFGGTAPTAAAGGEPSAIAVDTARNLIYTCNSADNTVSVIDGSSIPPGGTTTVPPTINVGSDPIAIAFNPTTNTVYVANNRDGTVSVIDGNNLANLYGQTAPIVRIGSSMSPAPNPAAIAVDPVRNKIYVIAATSGLSVIDGANPNFGQYAPSVGAPALSLGINTVTNTIYVAGNGVLSVIDGSNPPFGMTAPNTVTIGATPRAVAVDSTRNIIYVANTDSQSISVIDGANPGFGTTAPTVGANGPPFNVVVDTVTNQVYIGNDGSVSTFDGSRVNQGGSLVATTIPGTAQAAIYFSLAVDQARNVVYATGLANGLYVIGGTKDAATVSLGSLSQAYDGTPRAVTVTTVPAALACDVTYNGSPAVPTATGSYSVVATVNDANYSGSGAGTLTVTGPPTIETQPSSLLVGTGSSATFAVSASGLSPAYQWFEGGVAIPGATDASYTIAAALPGDAGSYTVTVTDIGGSVTSTAAALTVVGVAAGAPSFTLQPVSCAIATGSTAIFSVTCQSQSAVTYQWYKAGLAVAGATLPTLVVSAATTADAGSYACEATNAAGPAISSSAILSVVATSDPGRPINVSCRARAASGANELVCGFVIGGSNAAGSEPVLIRASGPALIAFNVAGPLPDPDLQLFGTTDGNTLIATNTAWGGGAAITAAAASVGAFAWTSPASLDAALIETLAPGAYTANISSSSGDSGVALAEIYDDTAASARTATSPHLVNISARSLVGTGSGSLIAGFVVGGTTSSSVLIRASGPALVPFNVTGTLPDPQLQLYRSNPDGTSTLMQSNAGWSADPQIAAAASALGAFSWGTSPTPDSALLVTLAPGNYTAVVSGVKGDSGIALVEVYEFP